MGIHNFTKHILIKNWGKKNTTHKNKRKYNLYKSRSHFLCAPCVCASIGSCHDSQTIMPRQSLVWSKVMDVSPIMGGILIKKIKWHQVKKSFMYDAKWNETNHQVSLLKEFLYQRQNQGHIHTNMTKMRGCLHSGSSKVDAFFD